jgi:hypothetical protein
MTLELATEYISKGKMSERVSLAAAPERRKWSPAGYLCAVILGVATALCAVSLIWG